MFKIEMKLICLVSVLLTILMLPQPLMAAKKTLTFYTWDSNIGVVATGSNLPKTNTAVLSVSFDSLLSTLNTTGTNVGAVTYIDSNNCTSIWASFQNYTLINDPEDSSCRIGSVIVPVKATSTTALRDTWTTYGSVSYDVQVKVGWYQNLLYAAQGLNIRWHESATSGKYEGYGISFINFNNQANCTTNVDYVPNTIKPGSSNSLRGKLLLVLWKQAVVGGVERRSWLAYADMGLVGGTTSQMNDPKVIGNQTSYDSDAITDNVTLMIRVEDKISGSQRHNDIKIFYGDPSSNTARTSGTRGLDSTVTNVYRGSYVPKCSASQFPLWPSNYFEAMSSTDQTLSYWSYMYWYASTSYLQSQVIIPSNRLASDNQQHSYRCSTAGTSGGSEPVWPVATGATIADGTVVWRENGGTLPSRPTTYDYFTLLSTNPQTAGGKVVTMVINPALVTDTANGINPANAAAALQSDRATIRTSEFTLETYPSARPEIALHGMGNMTGSNTVAFNDLAVQILGKRE